MVKLAAGYAARDVPRGRLRRVDGVRMLAGMPTQKFEIDHLAYASFDAAATHRFYADILGFPLVAAQLSTAGPENTPFMLTTYAVGDGRSIDFIVFEGMQRPPADGLPPVIRHVGVSVGTEAHFEDWLRRFDGRGVPYLIEVRGDGRHAFVTDPNGVLFEVSADPAKPVAKVPSKDALAVFDGWVAKHARGS